MDGFQATEAIRRFELEQNKESIPIVALTAFATQGFREQCLQKGMDEYLTKPLKRKMLLELLEKFLISSAEL
jgi:CheY-like chemotaxis protein